MVSHIYVAARLYSALDRFAAGLLAMEIERQAARQKVNGGLKPFLPFRDTNQQAFAGENKARAIYEADLAGMAQSVGLVALYDGLTKDSGVSMEVGFAYGRGLPVGILLTDFIYEGFDAGHYWTLDPIIACIATHVSVDPDVTLVQPDYSAGHLAHLLETMRDFVEQFMSGGLARRNTPAIPAAGAPVYCDVFAGRYDWSRRLQAELAEALGRAGVECTVARRYNNSGLSPEEAAQRDIDAMLGARVLVVSLDGGEIDAGTGALVGLARAMDKQIVMVSTSQVQAVNPDGQRMRINLMIEQAADRLVTDIGAFADAVLEAVG